MVDGLDWVVIALYFAVVFGIAGWAYVQERQDASAAGYFLGGRNVGWFVVGASLFVSNIGSEHLIGLSGTGADSGLATGQFEILASLVLLLLGWLFVPFYVKSGVFTMPEFLEKRYSRAARTYLSYFSIVAYILTKISVTLFAGGIVFEVLLGMSFWTGAVVTVVVTGTYTIFGGLRAVVYTDMLQMVVLVLGAAAVTIIGLGELGGWGAMVEASGDGFMSVWKPMSDPDFPWTGILLGAPILAVWYWCTDQVIVQRTLAARNEVEARRGTIFAGYLKLLPLFIFVVPGVIAYGLSQRGDLDLASSDDALPQLVGTVLPSGMRGLVAAGLLAALMSSLSSVFNSSSTLITWDIYKHHFPDASDKQLVTVGRLSTAVLTGLGLLWIPLISNVNDTLYTYLQSVQSYIAPPIAAVFLLGIAWKRANAAGAMWTLVVGAVLGASRLVLELVNGTEQDGLPDGVLSAFAEFNFLHLAFVLFVVCCAVLVGVSLATSEPPPEKVIDLTFQTVESGPSAGGGGGGGVAVAERTRTETETETATTTETGSDVETEREMDVDLVDEPGKRRRDALLSLGVIAGVVAMWVWFSPLVFG